MARGSSSLFAPIIIPREAPLGTGSQLLVGVRYGDPGRDLRPPRLATTGARSGRVPCAAGRYRCFANYLQPFFASLVVLADRKGLLFLLYDIANDSVRYSNEY